MRILMITSDFYDTGHGGVEGHILGLATSLQKQGHDVIVVRNADRPVIHPEYDARVDEIDYRVLPRSSAGSRGWARRLRWGGRIGMVGEFLRRTISGARSSSSYHEVLDLVGGRIDVVHQHNFLEGVGLTKRFSRNGTRVVWTNHLGEFLYVRQIPIVGGGILRQLTSHYSAAAAPSAELADAEAIRAPVRLIPNGVDVERFRPSVGSDERSDLRARFGWPSPMRVVIVPRRWAPTKGVIYAAQAMSLDSWPEGTHVVFAGSGTQEYPGYADEIRAHLNSARVPYEIHESVSQSTMAEMLRAADVCLVPSVKEATSLSALEAMASGIVVVAARVGGLPEIIDDGVTGFLHDPKDASSVAVTVSRALESTGTTTEARRFVCDGYSWDAVAARTSEIYGATS